MTSVILILVVAVSSINNGEKKFFPLDHLSHKFNVVTF